jgi:hypothetical protein
MSHKEEQLPYFAYLLRVWLTRDGEQWVWRASLEYPTTGERRGFAGLSELVAYLQEQMSLALPEEDITTFFGD